MLKNYIITAFRNLSRNKVNTSINVLGLTMGLTCSLVLFLVVRYELSFNVHHPDSDRIYRVVGEFPEDNGAIGFYASTHYPFANAFATSYPEIPVTFVHRNFPAVSFYPEVNGEQQRFEEGGNSMAYVHQDFLEIFPPEWIGGNPETALADINSVVLTRKIAEKYFGTIDAVGHTLKNSAGDDLLVTGVIENRPNTTDNPMNLMVSIMSNADYRTNYQENWGGKYGGLNAFIKLPEGMTKQQMESNFVRFDSTQASEEMSRLLQPLSDLHFNSALGNQGGRTISKSNLWAMGIIGALLLFAACINFVNLNTALAVRRSKEVGIRKVLGSSRMQLFYQFMGETFVITFVALLVSFGATELALINLKSYLGYDLEFNIFKDTASAIYLAGAFLFAVLFSGLYPAFILSSYKPVVALKNKMTTEKKGGVSLRKILVTSQLMISQALIICTVIVIQQMDYFYNAPIGLDKESVMELYLPGGMIEEHQLFKTRVEKIPGVESMTVTNSGAISTSVWSGPSRLGIGDEVVERTSELKYIDKDFLKTYGIELLLGENVVESDSIASFLVNEEFIKQVGLKDMSEVMNLPISIWGREGFVRGVVSNYNTRSLHSGLSPVVMTYGAGYSWCALRFNTDDVTATIATLGKVYNEIFPEQNFDPEFLDTSIENFYTEEEKASTLFQIAAVVAIFIGCIGLIGLISYMVSTKIKEIGIRKVLGASVANILLLFSRQFLMLTLVGFALATPLAWYLMDGWLQNYENRILIGPEVFGIALMATMLLVVLSIGIRAYHSAAINPAKSLRSE